MKHTLSCLLFLALVLGCHHNKPTQPTQRVECFSYEEPTCSACLRGSDKSCQTLLDAYQSGEERARDLSRASFFWQQASLYIKERCGDDAPSCEQLGQTLWSGTLTARDTFAAERYFVTAERLYRDKCDKKDIAACLSLASLFKQPGYKKPKQELEIYELLLSFGEGAAIALQRELWLKYHRNDRAPMWTMIDQSPEMERLCFAGDLDVCVTVGNFYAPHTDGPSEFFSFACERGNGHACSLLADQQSGSERIESLQKSCKAFFVGGCRAYFASQAGSWEPLIPTWQLRCQQGNKLSCELLSLPDGEQPFKEKAKEKLSFIAREDCIHGDGRGCMRWLSSARKEGMASQVKPVVRRQVEKGCGDGIPEDCGRLASLLIPKEKILARQAMERGCLLGSMEACVQLSSIVWWGEDSIENKTKTSYYACLAEQLHPFKITTNICQSPN
jgi:TPR repeat protein